VPPQVDAGSDALDRPPLGSTLLAIDYDGTLAPIVDDPGDAHPLPGLPEVLVALAERGADVLVVSGRPVAFLASQLPAGLQLVGLYGLEGVKDGRRWEHPNSGAWREAMADVAAAAAAVTLIGMRVELKDVSITLHYRGSPEIADTVAELAESLAARSGLEVRKARQAVELHPPIHTDKGTVIEDRVGHATDLVVIGDDVADLAAFAAADRLAARGVRTTKVAVGSEEAPPELLSRADLMVDGPPGVLDLLRSFLPNAA